MIYMTCGHYRSGTSMLMQCLARGGMTPVYDPSLDAGQRNANPRGFFETNKYTNNTKHFIRDCRNRLVKMPMWSMAQLPSHEFTVVMARRDSTEIHQSMLPLYQQVPSISLIEKTQNGIQFFLENKMSANVSTLYYQDVVEDPVTCFKMLRNRGFPIDPIEASKGVDPRLYRNRHLPTSSD